MAEGRAERESVPLEAHGEWAAPDDRPDPVGILEEQNATRVPELVPIRHGRMIVSPFTFYRGERGDHGVGSVAHARRRGCACSAAAMRTCRTSACSRRRIAGSCSISTTSTRRCRRRSSGTSSAWWRASSSPPATTATGPRSSARRRARPPRPTGRRWPRRRRCASWTSGTRGSTPTSCSRSSLRRRTRPRSRPPEGAREGADADEPRLAGEVRRAGRRRLPDQAAAAGDRAPARDDVRRLRADHPPGTRRLCALAGARSARRARPLPLRGLRAQGRRRRLGRDRGVDGPADGRPRGRSAVPADQGGERVGARPVRGRQRVRAPGRAGGARPAAHAGRERRLPGLGHRAPASAGASSMSASCAT